MKKLLVVLILCSLTSYSQLGPPSSNDGLNPDVGSVPINNGLYVLLVAGLFLGYYKLKK